MKTVEEILDEFTHDNWEAVCEIALKVREAFDPDNATPSKYRRYQAAVMITRLAYAAIDGTVSMTLDEADAKLTPPSE
jgi:hypothetical protein